MLRRSCGAAIVRWVSHHGRDMNTSALEDRARAFADCDDEVARIDMAKKSEVVMDLRRHCGAAMLWWRSHCRILVETCTSPHLAPWRAALHMATTRSSL